MRAQFIDPPHKTIMCATSLHVTDARQSITIDEFSAIVRTLLSWLSEGPFDSTQIYPVSTVYLIRYFCIVTVTNNGKDVGHRPSWWKNVKNHASFVWWKKVEYTMLAIMELFQPEDSSCRVVYKASLKWASRSLFEFTYEIRWNPSCGGMNNDIPPDILDGSKVIARLPRFNISQ